MKLDLSVLDTTRDAVGRCGSVTAQLKIQQFPLPNVQNAGS